MNLENFYQNYPSNYESQYPQDENSILNQQLSSSPQQSGSMIMKKSNYTDIYVISPQQSGSMFMKNPNYPDILNQQLISPQQSGSMQLNKPQYPDQNLNVSGQISLYACDLLRLQQQQQQHYSSVCKIADSTVQEHSIDDHSKIKIQINSADEASPSNMSNATTGNLTPVIPQQIQQKSFNDLNQQIYQFPQNQLQTELTIYHTTINVQSCPQLKDFFDKPFDNRLMGQNPILMFQNAIIKPVSLEPAATQTQSKSNSEKKQMIRLKKIVKQKQKNDALRSIPQPQAGTGFDSDNSLSSRDSKKKHKSNSNQKKGPKYQEHLKMRNILINSSVGYIKFIEFQIKYLGLMKVDQDKIKLLENVKALLSNEKQISMRNFKGWVAIYDNKEYGNIIRQFVVKFFKRSFAQLHLESSKTKDEYKKEYPQKFIKFIEGAQDPRLFNRVYFKQ